MGPATRDRLRTYQPDFIALLLEEETLKHASKVSSSASTPNQMIDIASQHEERASTAPSGELNQTQGTSMWERVQAQRRAREQAQAAREEAFKRATQRRKQAAEAAKDAAFHADYADVLAGLQSSQTENGDDNHVMTQTQHVLDHKAKVTSKKQADLFNEWNTEVFDKIQRRLQSAVDKRTDKAITQRLRSQMDKYLSTTNQKLGVFRDVIIEADYDPLQAHDHDIRIFTGDIQDPLKRDMLKPQQEKALMGLQVTASSRSHTKQMLDAKMWGEGVIQSTPYGHNVDNGGDVVVHPMSDRAAELRRSKLHMDHYSDPHIDGQCLAIELGRIGKRPVQQNLGHGRQGLHDVIQHTCKQHPDITGGDAWCFPQTSAVELHVPETHCLTDPCVRRRLHTGQGDTSVTLTPKPSSINKQGKQKSTCTESKRLEARGKAHPPGPEQRRGRQGLTEIIQQKSNPYEDGRSLGDQWLEARGRAKPPGPEQRAGRQDLTEIIQQTSNPYVDGRSLGDQWLDTARKAKTVPKTTVKEFLYRSDCPPEPAKMKDPRRYVSVLVNNETLHPKV